MAVYKRAYRPYTGSLTPAWSRFAILPRYAFQNLFRSKVLTAYLILCVFPALVAAIIIYLFNSPLARMALGMRGTANDIPFLIDARFFYYVLRVQGWMAFFLAVMIGPRLVAPDLSNNALPLYLSRPFSRLEYVVGKLSVLFGLMAAIMVVPDLVLFILQGALAADGWMWTNRHIAWAILVSSLLWMTILSMLSLAISAWVKWRIAASGLLLGVFWVAAGFGEAINAVLRTYWGRLLNLAYLLTTVWYDLFDIPNVRNMPRGLVGSNWDEDIPVGVAWCALLALCFGCAVLLNKRLRAKEVVRG